MSNILDLGCNIGLGMIRKITDLWSGAKSDSLIDYTQVARVEPIVLIDTDCLYLESLSDVQQSLLSIFAGYYLQAVAISTSIGKIEVMRHLDKLNPRRNPGDSAVDSMGWLLAQESYTHGLPMSNKGIALEANALFPNQDSDNDTTVAFHRDTLKDLSELANLSVGKTFSVEITDGLHKASIMIAIRLMASSLPTSSLIHILSLASQDNSMKERYHAWRAGRLEFIKDLCFCQDLIDAHRKNLMADKDGIYTNLIKRARGNMLSTIVSGNPSVATSSNIVIISDTTAEQLELELNGKISSFAIREKMMKATYIMLMCVIDKQWERVTIYHRGIHLPTSVSVRDLKASNKGSGPDVSDILKAYQMGNPASL
jgi:hypothetical protein